MTNVKLANSRLDAGGQMPNIMHRGLTLSTAGLRR